MNLLILPVCLFANVPKDAKTITLYEHPYYFRRMNFNKKKIMLHRASMRQYFDKMQKKGLKVKYIEFDKPLPKLAYHCFDPIDKCSLPKQTTLIESPGFLISSIQMSEYRKEKKHFKFNPFYTWHKEKLNIIPTIKSQDKLNQKRLPSGIKLPPKPKNRSNKYVVEAAAYTNKHFAKNIGNTDNFFYPTSHTEARSMLKSFVDTKFSKFGDFQDSMTKNNHYLFHSLLSSSINIGLITPKEVLSKLKKTPTNSYEGFIRQLFWREYQRYCFKFLKIKKTLAGNTKKLTKAWYSGSTGIEPVDDAIVQGINTGYLHHIYRLMIVGNYMNLSGISPKAGHQWFMEFSCDSYEWVMFQNVYDMVFFCSGGKTTWKSYLCSSKYVIKMSDYKRADWADKWDKLYNAKK